MSFKRKFSLKRLIGSGFALAVLPLFAALVWVSSSVRETSALNKQTSVEIVDQTRTLSLVLQRTSDVERKARLFVLLSDPALRQPYERESYESAREAFRQALTSLLSMRLDNKVALIANELSEKEKLIYQRLTATPAPDTPETALDLAFQGMRDSASALSSALGAYVDIQFKGLREQSDNVQSVLLTTGLSLIAFAGLIALFLIRTTSLALQTLGKTIDRFGTNDLTRQPTPDAPRDILEIADHLESLRGHITALRSAKHGFMVQLALDLEPALGNLSDTLLQLDQHPMARLDPDLKAMLKALKAQNEAIDTSVSTLIEYAKLDKPFDAPLQTVHLHNVVLEAVNALQPRLKAKSLNLCSTLTPVEITGWERQLYGLICELLDNAIHYSPVDGEIRILLQADSGHILLEVEDEGTGIPAEHRNWVFQPFFRYPYVGDDDEPNRYGLGLAKVKHYVANHGGIVEVLDPAGDNPGTLIRVILPQSTEINL